MKYNKISLVAFSVTLLLGNSALSQTGNIITGEGLPNPNPEIHNEWGTLPDGREWGSTAGIDIDPTDGHVVGYERCASGSAGGPGVNCDSNPVDPILNLIAIPARSSPTSVRA